MKDCNLFDLPYCWGDWNVTCHFLLQSRMFWSLLSILIYYTFKLVNLRILVTSTDGSQIQLWVKFNFQRFLYLQPDYFEGSEGDHFNLANLAKMSQLWFLFRIFLRAKQTVQVLLAPKNQTCNPNAWWSVVCKSIGLSPTFEGFGTSLSFSPPPSKNCWFRACSSRDIRRLRRRCCA